MGTDTKAPPGGEQRRTAVRAAMTRLRCNIWMPDGENCIAVAAQVENLSATGLLVDMARPVPTDMTVRCHLSLEDEGQRSDRVALWARGVRVTPQGSGFRVAMEFVLNEGSKRDRLHRWVTQHLARLRQRYGNV